MFPRQQFPGDDLTVYFRWIRWKPVSGYTYTGMGTEPGVVVFMLCR
jgi:hypothetical protein